jgi:hypothetical protein
MYALFGIAYQLGSGTATIPMRANGVAVTLAVSGIKSDVIPIITVPFSGVPALSRHRRHRQGERISLNHLHRALLADRGPDSRPEMDVLDTFSDPVSHVK